MKKLFLLIGAVLVSLAMQATVQKVDWDFSEMTEWDSKTASFNAETGVVTANDWRGVSNWGWLEKGDYDKLVVEIADHNYAVLVKVKTINDGEDDKVDGNYVNFQEEISAEQNCLVLDLASSKGIIKYIELDNWSEHAGATFTIKRIYLLKTSGIEITRPLWSGENAFGNWEHSFEVDPFARVYEYDEMVITYTKESDPQCQVKICKTDAFLDYVGAYVDVSGATQASFLLSAADVAAIKAKGFYLNGKNMTIQNIQIRSHETLSSEEKAIGNWEKYIEIPASKLSDIQIGNEICVSVTAIGETNSPRVSLFCGWSLSDALVGGEYYFKSGDAASSENPFIVRFPVTGSMKQQLGSHNMLLRGVNYTVTDVYVEEGTPVAESGVKGYLTVSTARMATFVLPFNVSTLPAGVQAYDLTYDGSNVILATEVTALTADQPVLIIAAAGEYAFDGEDGSSADISGKTGTYANGALIGTYQTIEPLAENDGAGNNNYILSNGTDGVAFYQVLDNKCSVAPYRAYLSCTYNANAGGSAPARRMRIVFKHDAATGIESIQPSAISTQKLLKDGQLIIIRNGVEYNVNGQMTK